MDGAHLVPWYRKPAVADAWHHVAAPGGYEWWYFDAEDPATDTQIVAIFLDGFVFHPGYLRRYARYRRRPTRFNPPVAADYPCAYFVVYRGGKIWAQFMTQYPTAAFAASDQIPQVAIGPNRLHSAADGIRLRLEGTPWHLTWRGPRLNDHLKLEGDFTFKPLLDHPPCERLFFSKRMSGAEHHWVVANPLCDVSGSFAMGSERIDFRGRGYHDHNYGTAPIGPGLKRWAWGRALLHDRVYTFHFARPADSRLADEVHLLLADQQQVRELSVQRPAVDWSRRNATLLAYPAQLSFDNHLKLSAPRLVDSSPFYMRMIYNAQAGDEQGTAFCEVACPHRLRWPVLGRMIEMSIQKR